MVSDSYVCPTTHEHSLLSLHSSSEFWLACCSFRSLIKAFSLHLYLSIFSTLGASLLVCILSPSSISTTNFIKTENYWVSYKMDTIVLRVVTLKNESLQVGFI